MSNDAITADVLFAKVNELQAEVAKVRAEKRALEDRKDREAQLERRLANKTKEIEKLKEQIRTEDYTMREMLKIRDMVAVAFDLYKGDGWAGWKRCE